MTNAAVRLALYATDFADADVTLPLAGVLALALALFRLDLAGRWLLLAGGAFGTILALKLLFGVVIVLGAALEIRSPSGHTCSSSLVYGGLALLLSGRWRVGVAVAVAVALLIGGTRLELGAHSVPEVLIGGAVGVSAVALFGRLLRHQRPLRRAPRLVLLTVAIVTTSLFYGKVAGIEGSLDKLEYRADRAFGLPSWAGEQAYLRLYGG